MIPTVSKETFVFSPITVTTDLVDPSSCFLNSSSSSSSSFTSYSSLTSTDTTLLLLRLSFGFSSLFVVFSCSSFDSASSSLF